MKHFTILACLLLLVACTNDSNNDQLISEKETAFKDDYVVEKEGVYKEFYGSNDQLKIEGYNDKEGKRHGMWTSFFPDGRTQSTTEYKHGLKDGYTVVYHSNGSIYYSGEYRNDEKVGTWSYYDVQTGKKNQVKEYGYPDKKK